MMGFASKWFEKRGKTAGGLVKRIAINYIVINGNNERDDAELFFHGFDDIPAYPDDDVTYIAGGFTMWDILFHAGLFSSKSQARKNWTRTGEAIPKGFSHFIHLGCAHSEIAILNPIAGNA